MLLPSLFWQWQVDYQPSVYVLALSGGRDSVVLLDILATQRVHLSASLQVCHVNHGWHHDAPIWSAHCAALCKKYHLPFNSIVLELPKYPQTSREAQARTARYEALAKQLPNRGVLLTAHHQNDQAETLLLQLFRGSGVAGLAAMPQRKSFASGEHWRPLLGVSGAMLQNYAQQHNLHWIDDPSNSVLCYSRNRLRHEVLPILERSFPHATAQIARSASWLAEAQELLNEAVDVYLPKDVCSGLSWTKMVKLSSKWQRALLRRWLQRRGLRPLGHRRLLALLDQLNNGSEYAELVYDEWVLIFYRGVLQAYSHTQPSSPPPVKQQTLWSGVGQLTIYSDKILNQGKWYWSLYPPGARFQPIGVSHSKSLKHWFQQAGLPPYCRRRIPLLWHDDVLVWVGGLGATTGYSELVIDWKKLPHSVNISPVF